MRFSLISQLDTKSIYEKKFKVTILEGSNIL